MPRLVERDAADRRAGLGLDPGFAVGAAAPVPADEARPLLEPAGQLLERGRLARVRFAVGAGALVERALQGVEPGLDRVDEPRERDGRLLAAVPSDHDRLTALDVARADL